MLGRGCDWHGATSHGAFLPPCRNKCKRYTEINVKAPTEPSPLQRAPEETASPSSSVLLLEHQHCSWHHSSSYVLSHSPGHPVRCPTQSPLSFLSLLRLLPCDFFPVAASKVREDSVAGMKDSPACPLPAAALIHFSWPLAVTKAAASLL